METSSGTRIELRGEPVEALLMRMIEELTDENQVRLERVIPGLGEAMAWPEPAASVGKAPAACSNRKRQFCDTEQGARFR